METTANFAKFSRGLDSVLSMMRNNLEFLSEDCEFFFEPVSTDQI